MLEGRGMDASSLRGRELSHGLRLRHRDGFDVEIATLSGERPHIAGDIGLHVEVRLVTAGDAPEIAIDARTLLRDFVLSTDQTIER